METQVDGLDTVAKDTHCVDSIAPGNPPPADEAKIATLDAVVAKAIRHALKVCRGNQRRASKALGISRWALQRKMAKHGIGKEG